MTDRRLLITRTPQGFTLSSFDDHRPRLVVDIQDTPRGRQFGRWFFANELPTMLPRRIPWRHIRVHQSFEWIDRSHETGR